MLSADVCYGISISALQRLIMKAMILGTPRPTSAPQTAYSGKSIVYHRSTKLAMDTIIEDTKVRI